SAARATTRLAKRAAPDSWLPPRLRVGFGSGFGFRRRLIRPVRGLRRHDVEHGTVRRYEVLARDALDVVTAHGEIALRFLIQQVCVAEIDLELREVHRTRQIRLELVDEQRADPVLRLLELARGHSLLGDLGDLLVDHLARFSATVARRADRPDAEQIRPAP